MILNKEKRRRGGGGPPSNNNKKLVGGATNRRDAKKRKIERRDDEILSDSDEEQDNKALDDVLPPESDEEDPNETAQQKKLRLTRKYLEELQQMKAVDADQSEADFVGDMLQEQLLDERGILQRSMADKCVEPTVERNSFKVLRKHRHSVTCLVVSNDSSVMFTASKDCFIMKWDLKSFKLLHTVKGGKKLPPKSHHTATVLCLAISTDDQYLASGSCDKMIHIWKAATMEHTHTFKGHRDAVSGLAFRVNSLQLFSCSHDRTVKVWDLDAMTYVETLYGHQDPIQAVDSFNKEQCVTVGGRDKSMRLWKIVEESQLVFQGGHFGSIDCLRHINQEHYITGADDGSVCLWSNKKKKPLVTHRNAHLKQENGSSWITSVAALKNSDLVATGSCDGFVKLWRCEQSFVNLKLLFQIKIAGFVNDMRFTSDGKRLILAVGQEHKLGRWWCQKHVKNAVWVVNLTGEKV